MSKKLSLILIIIAFLIGFFSTTIYFKIRERKIIADNTGMHASMVNMMKGLEGKTGDEFDKVFLQEMIMHHEGAVKMAESAIQNANHQDVKDFANHVISAQSYEISVMKSWLSTWYGIGEAVMLHDHSSHPHTIGP